MKAYEGHKRVESRRAGSLLAVAALLSLGAGCGGDDEQQESTATDTTTEQPAGATGPPGSSGADQQSGADPAVGDLDQIRDGLEAEGFEVLTEYREADLSLEDPPPLAGFLVETDLREQDVNGLTQEVNVLLYESEEDAEAAAERERAQEGSEEDFTRGPQLIEVVGPVFYSADVSPPDIEVSEEQRAVFERAVEAGGG